MKIMRSQMKIKATNLRFQRISTFFSPLKTELTFVVLNEYHRSTGEGGGVCTRYLQREGVFSLELNLHTMEGRDVLCSYFLLSQIKYKGKLRSYMILFPCRSKPIFLGNCKRTIYCCTHLFFKILFLKSSSFACEQ